MENDIMNIQEATQFLKFKSEDIVRRLCRKGKIPCRFIGGEYRFSRVALSIFVSGQDLEKYYQAAAKTMVENARKRALDLNNMGYPTYIAGLAESGKALKQIGTAYRINTDYPNIRSGASLNSSVVRIAPKSEVIYVVGNENGFYKLSDGTYLKIGFADKA